MFQNHGKEQDNECVARLKLTTQLVSHLKYKKKITMMIIIVHLRETEAEKQKSGS